MRKLRRFQIRLIRLSRIITHRLAILLLAFIAISISVSGFFYFFDSEIKADYYFKKASKLDDANPYGSREAVKYYSQSIKTYNAIHDRGGAVNAYIHLGLLHYKFNNITQVERMVLNAMEVGGDDIPKQVKAKAFMLLASTSEPAKAKEYIKHALDIAAELGQNSLIAKSYFILAKIYEYQANFELAKENYQKAVKISENLTKEDGFFDAESLYSNLGELYRGEGNYKESLKNYQKALAASRNNVKNSGQDIEYEKIINDINAEQRTNVSFRQIDF